MTLPTPREIEQWARRAEAAAQAAVTKGAEMDPETNLAETIDLVAALQHRYEHDQPLDPERVGRLCELVQGMHEWLARGGALPSQWERR